MENFDGRGCGIPFTIMLYQLTPGASRTKAVATAEVNFNSRKNGPCKRTADPKKNLQKKGTSNSAIHDSEDYVRDRSMDGHHFI